MLTFPALAATFLLLRALSAWSLLVPIENYVPSDSKSPIAVYYGASPLVFFANTSGLYEYSLPTLDLRTTLPGDYKGVTVLYGDREDSVATLLVEDSLLKVTSLKNGRTASLRLWGDYLSLCSVGSSFVYVFGKDVVKLVMVANGSIKEIGDFKVPVGAEACAASPSGEVFFGGNGGVVYSFSGNTFRPSSSIKQTSMNVDGGEIVGIAVYEVSGNSSYLLVSVRSGTVEVFSMQDLNHHSSLSFSADDNELEGIAIYHRPLSGYSNGSLLISFDEDPGREGMGIASLSAMKLPPSTSYNPRSTARNPVPSLLCSGNGFQTSVFSPCTCFTGFSGPLCSRRTCPNNCSSRGSCAGPNQCRCNAGWTGPDCSFKVVQADVETNANGGDGDDPAIWIHPTNRSNSRILTTTKSENGAGFAMFDLVGNIISQVPAGEPDNVDVIYNFRLSDDRVVDLAVAGCRDKNTICLVEVKADGLSSLVNLKVKKGFKVYGSCVYNSRISGKRYVFINSKTAEYLQYEVTPSLEINLVREFIGGNGGQVEGCVCDDDNGRIYIGEEPFGLWRYSAEPDGGDAHILIDSIEGNLFPDVEGVTLVNGKTPDKGLLIVSCQGVSAFNVYRRGGSHEFVGRFTVQAGKVDKVTNTDGVAAVGTNLGLEGLESGVLVVHDDVNSAPDGSRELGASFKLVGLGDILKDFGLQDEVDTEWDPRKA